MLLLFSGLALESGCEHVTMHRPGAILIRENKPTISGKMSLSTTRKHSSRMRIAHFGGHHYMSVLGGKYLVYVPSRIPTLWVYLPQDTFPQYAYPQIPTSLGILDIYPLPWVYLTPWIPTPSPMGIPNPLDTYPLSHGIPTCPGYYPRIPSPKCTYPWVYIPPYTYPLGFSTPPPGYLFPGYT